MSEKYLLFASLTFDWQKHQLSLHVWKHTLKVEVIVLQMTAAWTFSDINEDEQPKPLSSAEEPSLSASDCLN